MLMRVPQEAAYAERAVFAAVLLSTLLALPVWAERMVTLGWDPSSSPNITGYNVYYGPVSSGPIQVVSVGNATSAKISGLIEGVTYSFTVTATDATGLESLPSNQVFYTVPGMAVSFSNWQNLGSVRTFEFGATGPASQAWTLEGSSDLKTWKSLLTGTGMPFSDSIVVSSNPSLMFRFGTSTPGQVPPTTMIPSKGFPNSFTFTSTNALPEWRLQSSSDFQNWQTLLTKTNSNISVSVIFSQTPMIFFRVKGY